jgi:GT2 family glycosyltransferase
MDRLGNVLGCIESLKRQTMLPKEIILALDPDQNLIEFYKSRIPDDVKIVVSEGNGLSYARNTGVKNAEGEIVAFIDDDAVADSDWLKNLIENYNPCVIGVGGLIKPIWESGRSVWFPEELDWIFGCSYKGLPEEKTYVRNPIGCNMSFRKSVFEKVGYFKIDVGRLGRRLLGSEETEFSIRATEKILGSKIVFDPSAVVYHAVPKGRTRLTYVIKRACYEGLSKAMISSRGFNPLATSSTEYRYFKYLLKVAIPTRLKRLHRLENICHLVLIFMSLCLIFLSFSVCMLAKTLEII